MNQNPPAGQNLEACGPLAVQTFAFSPPALKTNPAGYTDFAAPEKQTGARRTWAWLSEAVQSKWKTALIIVVAMTLLGSWAGLRMVKHPATASLIGESGVSSKESALSLDTAITILQSPEFTEKVITEVCGESDRSRPANVQFSSDSSERLIQVRSEGADPQESAFWANKFAQKSAEYLKAIQTGHFVASAAEIESNLQRLEDKLNRARVRLAKFKNISGISDLDKETAAILDETHELGLRISTLQVSLEALRPKILKLTEELAQNSPELVSIREKLNQALAFYTDEHPKVKELRAALSELEGTVRSKPEGVAYPGKDNPVAANLYLQLLAANLEETNLDAQIERSKVHKTELAEKLAALEEKRPEYATLKADYDVFYSQQQALLDSARKCQLASDAVAPFRVLTSASPFNIPLSSKIQAGIAGGSGGYALGLLAVCVLCGVAKKADRSIRSEADLRRASRLPVLSSLQNLDSMNFLQQRQWALKTFALLKAGGDKYGGFECGFISSNHWEGRSTVVNLLAEAATNQGFRVVVVSTTPFENMPADPSPLPFECHVTYPSNKPIMRVSFPGGDWEIARRNEWWESLQQFASNPEAIVLVDLPPASNADSLFLGRHLDRVVWISRSDMSNSSETFSNVNTLQAAGLNLVGAVLNKAGKWGRRGVTVAASLLLMSCSLLQVRVSAAEVQTTPPHRFALSGSAVAVLAPWQQRLTLGPGDVLNISLYEQADAERPGVVIGPDGRINYLNAQDVVATGLTVDELRAKLEQILEKFIRSPRVVIVPQAYRSKQYYLLGNVLETGAYPLDRPVSVVEAIARAKGFVTAAHGANVFTAVDFGRSFMIERTGETNYERADIDFEALFTRGDLTQNRPLSPDNYLYFAPANVQENYVLGEVRSPGPTAFTAESTALKAIVLRGGFTETAWKPKILIIRGSLNHPVTIVVNCSDILAARAPDFKLEARDIVYVSRKPWAKAEELLRAGISDFLKAAVLTYTGEHVSPLIKEPLF